MTDDQDKDANDKKLLEEIFCFRESGEEDPQSWQAWRSGESDYKPFSLQYRECHEDGSVFLEKCHICGHELLMCKKYGGQCRSGKCKPERIGSDITS